DRAVHPPSRSLHAAPRARQALHDLEFLKLIRDENRTLNNLALRVFYGGSKFVVSRLGRGKSEHHDCVACCSHEILALLDDLPILSMVEPEFLPPIVQTLEDLQAPGLHPG